MLYVSSYGAAFPGVHGTTTRLTYAPASRNVTGARIVAIYTEFAGGAVQGGTWRVFLQGNAATTILSRMNTGDNNADRYSVLPVGLILLPGESIYFQSQATASDIRFACGLVVDE